MHCSDTILRLTSSRVLPAQIQMMALILVSFVQGETWTIGAGGETFNRWWGEDHYGDRRVRKHGHSTGGEYWDQEEQMDTYYNPIPHFDYRLALQHSPQLRSVGTLPRGGSSDFEGGGLSAL